jgi:predicted metal-dependent HD superfamily phosphohydrolase
MTDPALHDRWEALCARIGAFERAEHADLTFELIETLYATPPRSYHNLEHVGATLAVFDEVRRLADEPDLVEFALWMHDSVYEADKDNNEARSAETAGMIGGLLGCTPEFIEGARVLIMATHHTAPPPAGDPSLIADIDLAILSAAPEAYDAYAQGIRGEYAFVEDDHYSMGRAAFLERMLDRKHLFNTAYFRVHHESDARSNMQRELDSLP